MLTSRKSTVEILKDFDYNTAFMKKVLYFIPAIIYYGLVFFISSRSSGIKINIYSFDKVAHFVEFTVLAILLFYGFTLSLKRSHGLAAALTFIAGTLFAALDEIHQLFVPRRDADILDVGADVLGVIVGIALFWFVAQGIKLKIYGGNLRR